MWVPAAGGEWFEVRNPADTAEVVGEFPSMGLTEAETALDRAHVALASWRGTPIIARGEILRKAAALLRARLEQVAHDVTREMGKLIAEARGEVGKAADFLDYYGSSGRWATGELLPDAREGVEIRAVREPRGVVVAITPWNDPVVTPARKLGPALVAGNTVVLKPAPEAPLAALALARALHDSGLPAGVLNVLTGHDEVGRQLVSNGGVDAVTFTGSTHVGLGLQRQLAGTNVAIQTEMGGKNAAVVLSDANLDLVIESLVFGAFGQAGQRCTSTSRVLVPTNERDGIAERLAEAARQLRVGPGLDEASEMGPVVSEQHLHEVVAKLQGSVATGATITHGGERLLEGELGRGLFLAPTVVSEVRDDSELWREELFAPVVSVLPVDSFDDAIQAVNNSRYGLSASIFTRDLEAAYRFADEVEVGCVAVNLPTAGWDVHVPFGGIKDSGSAFREQGVEALHFYTRGKSIAVRARGIA
jgi:aldehyde dehydrogenase (NAD+)